MPVFEFKCTKCGCNFDLLVPVNYESCTICIKCNATAERVWSGQNIGVKYEGTGFYCTDNPSSE